MTIPRLNGFRALWKRTPPLRAALATIISGLGGTASTGASSRTSASVEAPKKPDLQSYIEGFAGAGLAIQDNRKRR